jgi:exopolysaccharide/PEP-CTERM locus tyrosine autokinase
MPAPKPVPVNSVPLIIPAITLDLGHLQQVGLLPEAAEAWRTRDQYRVIKRHLLRPLAEGEAESELARRKNLIMVTSSLPAEGKTYTAFNLGLSIARERDYSVILVDADIAKRDLSQKLGLQKFRGLVDLLRDDMLTLADVIVPTNIPGLKVIPSGPFDETASELLASLQMVKRVNELLRDFSGDVVLFDSGPLIVSNEASVLADRVGQIAMIVHAGVTLQDSVTEALSRINSEAPIGVILNGWEPTAIFEQQYYGTQYGYGGNGDGADKV